MTSQSSQQQISGHQGETAEGKPKSESELGKGANTIEPTQANAPTRNAIHRNHNSLLPENPQERLGQAEANACGAFLDEDQMRTGATPTTRKKLEPTTAAQGGKCIVRLRARLPCSIIPPVPLGAPWGSPPAPPIAEPPLKRPPILVYSRILGFLWYY